MQTAIRTLPLNVSGGVVPPPPMGTAQVTALESTLTINPGQSVTLTYAVTGATSVWLQLPSGRADIPASGTFVYTPSISGPFPLFAQDSSGGVVVEPLSVVVHETLPALDHNSSATRTTVQDGAWDDPATWGGTVPGLSDTALILHHLTVTGRGCQTGRLLIDGSVSVVGGVLYASDVHVRVSGSITLDGSTQAGKSLVMLRNRPKHASDTADFWRAVFVEGSLTLRGKSTTSWVGLAVAPLANDSQLLLSSPVSGWGVGNKLWLPDSRQIDPKKPGYAPHGEIVVVRGVSSDGLTVHLLRPCLYDHPADQVDGGYKPHAVNLIRTAGFVTSDPTVTATRAHIQFTGRAAIDGESAVFHGFGRTLLAPAASTASRHNVHLLNLVGPSGGLPNHPDRQWRLVNCVFLDPFPVVPSPQVKWGFANTNSHYGDLTGSVSFNWAGAAFVGAVTGNESFNVYDHCFATKVIGSGNRGESGTGGDGFWFRGGNNYVRNCVAAQIQETYGTNPGNMYSECYGFVLNMLNGASVRFPNFQGADTTITGQYTTKLPMSVPPLQWSGNTTYCSPDGFTYWWIGMANGTNPIAGMPQSFIDHDVWSVWRWGCFAYQSYNLTITGDMRGSIAAPTGQGILFSDYPTQNLTVMMDIQGFNVGIYPCVNVGGGWQRFLDCHLRNVTNIQIESPWTSASSASGITAPRLIYIDDCTYGAALPGKTFTSIQMLYATTQQRDIVKLDQTFVTGHGGVPGDDFQVFYTQQASTFVVPQTTYNASGSVKLQACPVAGLSNHDAKIQYGVCIAGEEAPAGAHARAGVAGLVSP